MAQPFLLIHSGHMRFRLKVVIKYEPEYKAYMKKDTVLVRNSPNRCMTRYKSGKVTGVLSPQAVFVIECYSM